MIAEFLGMLDGIFTSSVYAIGVLSTIHNISIAILILTIIVAIAIGIYALCMIMDGCIDYDDEQEMGRWKTIIAVIVTTLVVSISGMTICPSKTELIHMATVNYMRENEIPITDENLEEYFDMFYNFLNKSTPSGRG